MKKVIKAEVVNDQKTLEEAADAVDKVEVPFYYTIGENTKISCNIIKRLFVYEFMTMSALDDEEDTKNFDTLLQRIDYIEGIFNKAKEEIKAYKEKK